MVSAPNPGSASDDARRVFSSTSMASDRRNERQLERLRGAGTRKVESAPFEFLLPTPIRNPLIATAGNERSDGQPESSKTASRRKSTRKSIPSRTPARRASRKTQAEPTPVPLAPIPEPEPVLSEEPILEEEEYELPAETEEAFEQPMPSSPIPIDPAILALDPPRRRSPSPMLEPDSIVVPDAPGDTQPAPIQTPAAHGEDWQPEPRKRKRGRPRKHPLPEPRQPGERKPRASMGEPLVRQVRRAKRNKARAAAKGGAVPVIVTHLSEYQPLMQEGEEDPENDLLHYGMSFRPGVNAIDVFGQVCREVVDAVGQSLGDLPHSELKRKRLAIEAFGEELDQRCFEMTVAVSANTVLAARLRQAQRIKTRLQESLLEVRQEREKTALRIDEVRRTHLEATDAAANLDIINSDFHSLELALDRGRTGPQDERIDTDLASLEVGISRACGGICGQSEGDGLLGRVKSFNAFLERIASSL